MGSHFEIQTIEAHAEGEAGRIILDAERLVEGETMSERFAYCVEHLDPLRRAILREPRGYPGLCAVFILPPVNPGSDIGVIVLEQGGFTPMSGSKTICAVTSVLEAGIVPITGPRTEVRIDTAVGQVSAIAHVDGDKVRAVTVNNVPSFVQQLDFPLHLEEFGQVPADIVFGGQFFAQVDVHDLGLKLEPGYARQLARAGAIVKLATDEQVVTSHPLYPEFNRVNLIMIHSGDPVPGQPARNTVVLTNAVVRKDDPSTWTAALDRSPCGTGTSGRMAALYARGLLGIDEPFRHRSIVDTEFTGLLVGQTDVGGVPAVLPTITGRGWRTGRATWTLDPTDPFPAGYTVGDIWGPQQGFAYQN